MQEEEITSTDSLRQLIVPAIPQPPLQDSSDHSQLERSQNNKSSQRRRQVIPRSKISPPIKSQTQVLTLFNALTLTKDPSLSSQEQKQGKLYELVDEIPTSLKAVTSNKRVVELGSQNFKIMSGAYMNQLLQQVNHTYMRLQSIKLNMKIHKECMIDLEVQGSQEGSGKKRFIMTTNKANLSDLNTILNQESAFESISSSQELSVKQQKAQQIYKIGLDGSKLKGKWQILCIDFDKLIPQEAAAAKLKVTSLHIQAPQARVYDVQLVYTAVTRVANISQKMLKVSASTQSINRLKQQEHPQTDDEKNKVRQRKAYVTQEESKEHQTFTRPKKSIHSHKSQSMNARAGDIVDQSKTPQTKVQELPPLVAKNGGRQELKVIQEKVGRHPAKSAVVSSQKFKNAKDEGQEEMIDPSKMRYIQKLTERQKRMEERYFKKDNKSQPPVHAQSKDKKAVPGQVLPKPIPKMLNTANSNGFKDQSNFAFFGMTGMSHASNIDFKKSCTFSSTLRNFQYKPPGAGENIHQEDNLDNDVDESIQEEICQSQRGGPVQPVEDSKNGLPTHGSKPPIYNFQKHLNLNSRGDSAFTGGTTGQGALSTRSTCAKTPLMFGGSRQKDQTQYSQISGAKFSSATETKQDYFKFNKDASSSRSKLIFSPNTQNEQSDNELGNKKFDLQRYTQTVFEMDHQYEDTEEDASLYVVDAAIEYKADYGLERRPFSPPFKIL